MVTILVEVLQSIIPNLGSIVADMENRAALFSVGVFAFLLSQVWWSRFRAGKSQMAPERETTFR